MTANHALAPVDQIADKADHIAEEAQPVVLCQGREAAPVSRPTPIALPIAVEQLAFFTGVAVGSRSAQQLGLAADLRHRVELRLDGTEACHRLLPDDAEQRRRVRAGDPRLTAHLPRHAP